MGHDSLVDPIIIRSAFSVKRVILSRAVVSACAHEVLLTADLVAQLLSQCIKFAIVHACESLAIEVVDALVDGSSAGFPMRLNELVDKLLLPAHANDVPARIGSLEGGLRRRHIIILDTAVVQGVGLSNALLVLILVLSSSAVVALVIRLYFLRSRHLRQVAILRSDLRIAPSSLKRSISIDVRPLATVDLWDILGVSILVVCIVRNLF